MPALLSRWNIRSLYLTWARVMSAVGMTGTIWKLLLFDILKKWYSGSSSLPWRIARSPCSSVSYEHSASDLSLTVKVDIQTVAMMNATEDRTRKSHGGRLSRCSDLDVKIVLITHKWSQLGESCDCRYYSAYSSAMGFWTWKCQYRASQYTWNENHGLRLSTRVWPR